MNLFKKNITTKASLIIAGLMLSISVMAADKWTINHKDGDIRAFIEQIAAISGKNFIVDPGVKGKITVISYKSLGKKGVYELFLSVLQLHGFAVLEQNGVVKIVKQSAVRSSGVELDLEGNASGQKLVTRVIFIQNRSAMELVPLLRPMIAKYGVLAGVASANAIIISDHAYNLDRIEIIVKTLDVVNSEEIEVIQLEEAWVGNITSLLEKLVPEEVAAANQKSNVSRRIRVVADERSNSIILKGELVYRDRIRKLIKTLDKPSIQNASSKVILLNNADATTMAEMLKGFSGAVEKSQQQAAGGKAAPPTSPTVILADKDLNALVIRAEPTVLSEIESVITSLDVPRAQVLIEAIIVEVREGVDDALGIQWVTNPENTTEKGQPFALTQFTEAGSNLSGVVTGAAAPVPTFSNTGILLGIADPDLNIGAILQAVESQSNTNILSTPSIMTLDNKEASILVGGTIPFRTTSQSNSGNPFETISREDIGTTLVVIPHIQNDGTIRLEVDQKTESVAGKSTQGVVDIETTKREIKTEVLVNTGETIVLGGLISDEFTEGVSKVPFFGNLPGIGVLFRSKFTKHEKVNLMVFIRPTIVRDKVTEISRRKLSGLWELRFGEEGETPTFEQLFNGDINGGLDER